ncbi:MAG: hypothetical protein G01um101420_209 [Parcubacteria group bacterium Gr01-1014_20]|nr:MAG: hypothetical protein G01um101420_209 [Parcubacteria group bacterium Gr01-1014_20]
MTNENRLIKSEIDMAHYQADAVILWCVDDRFSSLLSDFIKLKQFKHVDLVKIAGGSKDLADAIKPENSFAFGQIKKLIELHHAPNIILVNHANCGAYGKKFETENEESVFHKTEFQKARLLLKANLDKNLNIETYFADRGGLVAS